MGVLRAHHHPVVRDIPVALPSPPSPTRASCEPRARRSLRIHRPCGRCGRVPRDPRRPRCGDPLRAPTRRSADDPSLAGRRDPDHGADSHSSANRRCRPDRPGVARPLKGTGRPSHREGVSRRRRVNPGLSLESSGRSSPTARPRAQALSGRASASDSRRQLNAGCGCRRGGGSGSPLSRLPRERVSKRPPGRQSQSPARRQNLVDGSPRCAQAVQPPSTDRSTGRNEGLRRRTAIDACANPV